MSQFLCSRKSNSVIVDFVITEDFCNGQGEHLGIVDGGYRHALCPATVTPNVREHRIDWAVAKFVNDVLRIFCDGGSHLLS
ncbi:hypothetical protein D3C84_1169880 [compost metagenome]